MGAFLRLWQALVFCGLWPWKTGNQAVDCSLALFLNSVYGHTHKFIGVMATRVKRQVKGMRRFPKLI